MDPGCLGKVCPGEQLSRAQTDKARHTLTAVCQGQPRKQPGQASSRALPPGSWVGGLEFPTGRDQHGL